MSHHIFGTLGRIRPILLLPFQSSLLYLTLCTSCWSDKDDSGDLTEGELSIRIHLDSSASEFETYRDEIEEGLYIVVTHWTEKPVDCHPDASMEEVLEITRVRFDESTSFSIPTGWTCARAFSDARIRLDTDTGLAPYDIKCDVYDDPRLVSAGESISISLYLTCSLTEGVDTAYDSG